MKKLLAMVLVMAASAGLALAGSGWHKVGDFDASGDAKEASVNRMCSVCLIKVTDGTVIINTIVVREGDNKTPIPIAARLKEGEHREVNMGGKKDVTGLRISDEGRGHYEVYVK